MKGPNLIVLVFRGLGLENLNIKARDLQVKNSTIVVTDVHGESHYIPKHMWDKVEIRQHVHAEVLQAVP